MSESPGLHWLPAFSEDPELGKQFPQAAHSRAGEKCTQLPGWGMGRGRRGAGHLCPTLEWVYSFPCSVLYISTCTFDKLASGLKPSRGWHTEFAFCQFSLEKVGSVAAFAFTWPTQDILSALSHACHLLMMLALYKHQSNSFRSIRVSATSSGSCHRLGLSCTTSELSAKAISFLTRLWMTLSGLVNWPSDTTFCMPDFLFFL